MKKKAVMKLLVISACALLTAGSIGTYAHANQLKDTDPSESVVYVADASEDDANASLTEILRSAGTESGESEKEETVYVFADSLGKTQKIIVSDWLKNPSGASLLYDSSILTDIVNVKGNESFHEAAGKLTDWAAQGNDIYYQGTTNKECPVQISLSYFLDGKAITPSELKGKSGHVTIRFDYSNTAYQMKTINGVEKKIYVPFTMLTGTVLENDHFRNIEVKNARLVNDGDRSVIVGAAFPGLSENLEIDPEKFEIPDYIEISADVTDFELGMTVTLAGNQLWNRFDTEKLNAADDLEAKMQELTDAMDQLTDGSSKLSDGLATLLSKSYELSDGVDQLANGTSALADGSASLAGGASQLQSGAASLSDGLNTIVSNNAALNDGAKQVFDTLLSAATSQLNAAGLSVPDLTIENYSDVLNSVIASLDSNAVYSRALDTVTQTVHSHEAEIRSGVHDAVLNQVESGVKQAVLEQVSQGVSQAVRAQVSEGVQSAVSDQVSSQVRDAVMQQVREGVKQAVYSEVLSAVTNEVNASVPEEMQSSPEVTDQINALTDAKMNSEEILSLIDSKVIEKMESPEIKDTINATTAAKMESEEIQQVISAKIEEKMNSDEILSLISAKTDEKMASEEIQSLISSNVDAKMNSDEMKDVINANTSQQVQNIINENMNGEEVQGKLAAASQGLQSVISLKASLDNYHTFYNGIGSYTAGVAQAASGAGALKDGAASLSAGAAKLNDGMQTVNAGMATLQGNMPALLEGVSKLSDGSQALSDGLTRFDEEGVQKLTDAVNGDLAGLADRIKATVEVSESYQNFSGISDNMSGNVKFIIKTAEIN